MITTLVQEFPLFVTDYETTASDQDIISQETEMALTNYDDFEGQVHVVVKIESETPSE